MATAIGIGIYQYNEIQNKKFPSIAVAYSNRGTEFVAMHSDYKQASESALQKCRNDDWGLFYKCDLETVTEAGSSLCVSFSNFSFRKPGSKLSYRMTNSLILATDIEAGKSALEFQCLMAADNNGYSPRICEREVSIACNFK